MADILLLFSFKISIRLPGVSGLSLFDLCLLNELFITLCQFINFSVSCILGNCLKDTDRFAFKLKLKPGAALKVSSRLFVELILKYLRSDGGNSQQ